MNSGSQPFILRINSSAYSRKRFDLIELMAYPFPRFLLLNC